MRVLVACEFSGIVRDAFLEAGHDAVSCDLLPTESPGPHVIGDVRKLLSDGWDLVVAHPPCTYLTNAGVRWRYGDYGHKMAPTSLVGEARWEAMREGADLFRALLTAPIQVLSQCRRSDGGSMGRDVKPLALHELFPDAASLPSSWRAGMEAVSKDTGYQIAALVAGRLGWDAIKGLPRDQQIQAVATIVQLWRLAQRDAP